MPTASSWERSTTWMARSSSRKRMVRAAPTATLPDPKSRTQSGRPPSLRLHERDMSPSADSDAPLPFGVQIDSGRLLNGLNEQAVQGMAGRKPETTPEADALSD